jgi:hypothetical protein
VASSVVQSADEVFDSLSRRRYVEESLLKAISLLEPHSRTISTNDDRPQGIREDDVEMIWI